MRSTDLPPVMESRPMAKVLRVPSKWLREEQQQGRLPGVTVDERTSLFNPRAVSQALAKRCKGDPTISGSK